MDTLARAIPYSPAMLYAIFSLIVLLFMGTTWLTLLFQIMWTGFMVYAGQQGHVKVAWGMFTVPVAITIVYMLYSLISGTSTNVTPITPSLDGGGVDIGPVIETEEPSQFMSIDAAAINMRAEGVRAPELLVRDALQRTSQTKIGHVNKQEYDQAKLLLVSESQGGPQPPTRPTPTKPTPTQPTPSRPTPTQPALPASAIELPPVRSDLSIEQRWVEAHNFYRRKHCVPDVTWNAEVSKKSKEWTDNLAANKQGQLEHGGLNWSGGRLGQNLAAYWSSGGSVSKPVEYTVADWYEEVVLPNVVALNSSLSLADRQRQVLDRVKQLRPGDCPTDSTNYIYGDATNRCNPETGHFTQVVWKDSRQIGCSTSIAPNGTVVAGCDYTPAGNYLGRFAENVKKC